MTLWIPKDLDPASQTMNIAETMIQDFGVSRINNDTYNDKFNEYYDQHIRQGETTETFCSKNGTGINVQYLIDNANKKTYVTLLSLEINPADPTDFHVLASIIFKWSPTAGSVKIQAFCSNQKQQTKGAGTKLLNFLKKTLTHMGINNIYLNPIPNAVSYYSSQRFKKHPTGKVHDSSSPKPLSKPKTKSKSKSSSKSKTNSRSKSSSTSKNPRTRSVSPASNHIPKPVKQGIPTMTINIRAANNWKKATSKIKSYQALTRKNHGKSHIPTSTKKLLAKIDKIVNGLNRDHRDMAQYQDIIEIFERSGPRLNDEEEDIVVDHLRDKYQIY
jgi:hypothetical protein